MYLEYRYGNNQNTTLAPTVYVHPHQNWVLEISVLEWRLGVGAWQAFGVKGKISLVTKSANCTVTIVQCVTADLNESMFIFFLDVSFNRLFQHPTKDVLWGVTNIKTPTLLLHSNGSQFYSVQITLNFL